MRLVTCGVGSSERQAGRAPFLDILSISVVRLVVVVTENDVVLSHSHVVATYNTGCYLLNSKA